MSSPPAPGPSLSTPRKIFFALGDHSVNVSLSALSLVYLIFLTDIAGLRPALAGSLIWVARLVDGVTDPLMGRLTDDTRTRFGRRRPYFLIGALPFGLCFALLWATPIGPERQSAMFAYYLVVYIGLSLSVTVLTIPYMALLPEMVQDYDERTTMNSFRVAAANLGTVVAATMQPIALSRGGGPEAWWSVGLMLACWMVLPWPGVFAASFERGAPPDEARPSLSHEIRSLAGHRTFRHLCALFINARIALDVAAASLIYYVTYWLGREGDFALAILCLLATAVLSLPVWLRVARGREKHRIFVLGTAWWVGCLVVIALLPQGCPRWVLLAITAAVGVGYSMADLMPWAMLGDVMDEGAERSGQQSEGLYNGFFTFLRKLGGATAILMAGVILDVAGYRANGDVQSPEALAAIRILATAVPGIFLVAAMVLAWRYPLGRSQHAEIAGRLARRTAGS